MFSCFDQTLTLDRQRLTADQILHFYQEATTVILQHCTSCQWKRVGVAVASLKNLHTLIVRHCNSGDALCEGLVGSASLRRLTIGTIIDNKVQCLTTWKSVSLVSGIRNLEELSIEICFEPKNEVNLQNAFKLILRDLEKLKVLDIPSPH